MTGVHWVERQRIHNSPHSQMWELKDVEVRIRPEFTGQYRVIHGYLLKGGVRIPGWYVRKYTASPDFARLNPNLTLDEAQSAAQLLLMVGGQ